MAKILDTSDSRVCREPSFPFLDHLTLGEIDRRNALATYRRKLASCGLQLSAAETWEWGELNRVPRRPPIYRIDPERVA